MNEKTKNILNWTIALVIVGGVLFLILFPQSNEPATLTLQKTGYVVTNPSMILLEYTTRNAISQFGGDMSMEGFNLALLLGATGIVVILILAPSLMVFGLKRSEHSSESLRPVTWHIGTGILLSAMGIGFYSAITFSISNNHMYEEATRQHAIDQMQFELMDLYFDAASRAILPHDKGGGNGSFTNFRAEDGSTRNIRLTDLERYNPDSRFEFVISDAITDSTITITAVSDFKGNSPDFRNANGETGKLQLSLTMNPYTDDRLNIKRENQDFLASN